MNNSSTLSLQLEQGILNLGLTLTPLQKDALLNFLQLLQKWNQVYNLTAVRDPQEMLTHHLLDSLSAISPLGHYLQRIQQADGSCLKLLDVGSGGGLPGVVFAICFPDLLVHCVDAVAKKVAFVQQVAAVLKLSNLKGIHTRVESLVQSYDIVSCRAFASLVDFTSWSRSAIAPDGVWLAMKGKSPNEEIAGLNPEQVDVFHVEPLQIPGLAVERCLVWMKPVVQTSTLACT